MTDEELPVFGKTHSLQDKNNICTVAENCIRTRHTTERRERRSRLSLRSSTGNDALACPSTYRSYVQLFETEIVTVDDSDDEGDKTIPMDGDISLPELLIKLQSQVDLEKITKFNINRNLVLDGARRAIKRKSFCAKKKSKISVKFTDDVGIAEGAVDEALEDNLYRDVGLFFSLSIVHGGPSPKFLSPVMYNALVGQAGERNIEDIADGDLRGEVQKLKDASSLQDLNKQMNAMSTLLITAGCFRPILNMQQKDKLIMDIVRFLVLERTSTPLHHSRQQQKTGRGEHCWILERFLIDLQEDEDGEITLGDVLSFATGADCVPPLGFDPSPSITFLHDSGLFPKANTCSMELKLPVSEDFNTFKKT
ncbi:G2H3 [Mytilus coruscus]|uniref:G2H3 n=1 Tax=Mytilus coruscus TaxID=42192 RepID=A0A6J8DN27_MYTCO|nr:G2H3 [Mytilus coruscus]